MYQDFYYATKIVCAIGGILFVVSDALIAVHEFYTPIPNRSVSYICRIFVE